MNLIKKFLLTIGLGLFALLGISRAQTVNGFDGQNIYWTPQGLPQNKTSVVPLPFPGVPAGSCLTTQLAVNSLTGDLYSCNNGVWQKSGGGAPSGPAGTATLGTSAIAAGTCATVVTVAATGTLTTSNIVADFNADPTSTVGYEAGAMLTIVKYPTAGNVNFKVCNNTVNSITPGAVTLNWWVKI